MKILRIPQALFTISFCLLLVASITISASAADNPVYISNGVVVGEDSGSSSEQEMQAKYIITVVAPHGWYTKTANVTVRIEDVNQTGFEKAEIKIDKNGSWQDISDALRAHNLARVEISDNSTIYVTVTDCQGKAHVKSLYIECFDRDAPTVRAKLDGRTLRVESDDALSGVSSIYVNGHEFDDLTNDTLDIRVKDYADTDYEQITIHAVDYAGNRSKTVTVKNPYYQPESSSKPEKNTSSSSSSSETSTAPTSSAKPETSQAATSKPVSSAPAPVPKASSAAQVPLETSQVPSTSSSTTSVTPTDGSGTVIENSVKTPEQREFFTISTAAGNDFYVVVDKEKSSKNVYLLSEVTEDDLTGLAKPSEHAIPDPIPEIKEEPQPEPEVAPQVETKPNQTNNTNAIITVIIFALVGGGAGYYFKIYKPKREALDLDDDADIDEPTIREDDSLEHEENGDMFVDDADEQEENDYELEDEEE